MEKTSDDSIMPPIVKDVEEVRVTAEIHPEPLDKCLFCQAPRRDHGEFSCPHRREGLAKLGLNTQERVETPTFLTIPDTQRRPASRRKRKCITVSDCLACPRFVPHDPARCRFIQGSKWTENGTEDVALSPRQELQLPPPPRRLLCPLLGQKSSMSPHYQSRLTKSRSCNALRQHRENRTPKP